MNNGGTIKILNYKSIRLSNNTFTNNSYSNISNDEGTIDADSDDDNSTIIITDTDLETSGAFIIAEAYRVILRSIKFTEKL